MMTDDMRQRYSSGMPWGLSGRVGGLPEAACAFYGFLMVVWRELRVSGTARAVGHR